MSDLATLHPFPRAQADRQADADALRSAEPLMPEVAPPDLEAIGGWQSLRMGAEVALRSRWMFMVALAAVSLLSLPGLLGARLWAQQSAHAMLGMLLFTYGIARGVDGHSRDRAFWVGLGVRPGAWELGTVLVDLGYMAVVAGVGLVVGPTDPVFLLIGLGTAIAAYGLGSATRAAAGTEVRRFGFMMGMLLVMGLNAAVAYGFSYGQFVVGVAMQLGIVAAAGLASRVLLSGRSPESAAGRGRRRWGWLGCALAGLLVVPLQFLQGKPDSTVALGPGAVLLLPSRDPLAGQQLWRMTASGERERLSVRGRIAIDNRGPHGSVAIRRTSLASMAELLIAAPTARDAERLMAGGLSSRFGLVTAQGDHIECDGPLFGGWTLIDDDGMGATLTLDTGGGWRLDDDGCRPFAPGETP
jgi:hypothetical protein